MTRRRRAGWAVATLAAGAVAAFGFGSVSGTEPGWLVAAVVAMTVLRHIPMPSSGTAGFTPAAMVVAALPLMQAGGSAVFDVEGCLAVAFGGTVSGAATTMARGRSAWLGANTAIRRAAGAVAYLTAFFAVDSLVPGGALDGWRAFVVFGAAAVVWMVAEAAAAWLVGPGAPGRGRRFVALSTLRDADGFSILVASGALFALAFEPLSWWALVVAAIPYAFARGAFRRFHDASTAYGQTMRALAQIPEVSGHTPPGHAARTADLAVALASELGVRPVQVREVEYAALMHDIGRLALNEPAVVRQGYTDTDIAVWGAEIVGEVSYLARVSEIVRRQLEPYRYPGAERSDELPLAARIVKVASAYDTAVTEGLAPLEALERLHQGSVYEYDPDIVAVLRGILTRRRVLHSTPRT